MTAVAGIQYCRLHPVIVKVERGGGWGAGLGAVRSATAVAGGLGQ